MKADPTAWQKRPFLSSMRTISCNWKIILALLCVCVISDANAFKCRTYMFPEFVSAADRIVFGTVEFSNSVPLVVVSKDLKGEGPRITRIGSKWVREKDQPVFEPGQRVFLFLQYEVNGVSDLLGYGDQAVWPKTIAKWPFDSEHICKDDDVVTAIEIVQGFERETAINGKLAILRQMIGSTNDFLRTVALECLSMNKNAGLVPAMKNDVKRLMIGPDKVYMRKLRDHILREESNEQIPAIKDRFAITNLIDAAGLNSGFKEVHYSENQYCLSGSAVNTRGEDKVFPKQKPAICRQTKDRYDN